MKTLQNALPSSYFCINIALTSFFQEFCTCKQKLRPISGQKNRRISELTNTIKELTKKHLTSVINYTGDPIIIIMRPKASLTYCYKALNFE
jgi:hypothetical protein